MPKVRVLVVEDSMTARRRLCDVLGGDPDIELVGEAGDGRRAIKLCDELRPDVMTLDMVLPLMSGLGATEYVMAHFPTPILIVSSSMNRGAVFNTFDALAAGAVDVLEKPRGDEPDGQWEHALRSAVKLASRIKVITHPRARLEARAVSVATAARGTRRYEVIALGASTGGPGALAHILRNLPLGLPMPVLIVLHIDEPFALAFNEWLSSQTAHTVRYAEDGALLERLAGQVVMAPPGRHLVVQGGRLHLTLDPERHSCRPSVDVLFESLAKEHGATTLACLLTGMGRDGAAGLLAVRKSGGTTLAQDEASSVVYGMPREAALIGAVERVLALPEIGPAIAALARRPTLGGGS